jgi:outer membrane immunogenic protein
LVAIGPLGADALAQDRSGDLPPYASGPSWTGFYAGVAFGGGIMESHVSSTGGPAALNVDRASEQGVLASIYGGVDYQILPRAVVGALVEGTWLNLQGTANAQVPGATANITRQADLGWSALLRAGVLPSPTTLLYLMGGYSGQNLHTTGNASAAGNFASFDHNEYFNGWTIGAGLETMLGSGWSTKLEYRFSQFESKTTPGSSFTVAPSIHAIRAGLTYRFGGLGGRQEEGTQTGATAANWTGIYVGGAAGASASRNHLTASFGSATSAIDEGGQSLLGTVFAGYDMQVAERTVIGVMGDLTWAGPQSISTLSAGGTTLSVTERTRMSWSVLGRIGFLPTPSTLLYAAGGYTGEYLQSSASATLGPLNANFWQEDVVNGWTIGPGIETIITGAWTTRLEYRYSQFEQKTIAGSVTAQPYMHTIRAGLSYKFGPGPAN